MGWDAVKLSEVNPNAELIPAGEYTFQLSGAKLNDRDPNRIDVTAFITTEGPQSGRKVFFSYPDPEAPKMGWVLKAMKRLEIALGVDQTDGEEVLAYLNRASGNRFATNIFHRSYTPEGGTEVVRAEVNVFNVHAAA